MSACCRTKILMEPEQHRMLSGLAQGEGRSLSERVRESVQICTEKRDRDNG
jgi:hypothetical protein